jgi:cbb3-type cytochrome oxidase maturation protein
VSVLVILIFFSILVAGLFLAAFLWSVKTGQYDDDYTPSVRMLFDDEPLSENSSSSINQNSNNAI